MGTLRPKRIVTVPTGTWELYASRTVLPKWQEGRLFDPEDSGSGFGQDLGGQVVTGVAGFFLDSILLPLARFFVQLPMAFVRGRRSIAVRIEAVNPFPEREVLLWVTTTDAAARVLDEIAVGLADGKVVQPVGAVYSGAET